MQLRSAMVGLALLLPGAVLAQEIEMKVELMGPLGTKTSHKGDRVFARVIQPDGLKGDTVEGAVKEVHSGGKLHGNSVLNFSFETSAAWRPTGADQHRNPGVPEFQRTSRSR